MSYQVLILRRTQKELARLEAGVYEAVRDAIADLAITPRPNGCTTLTGRNACGSAFVITA